ncbi:organic cation transporter protein-like [Oratosquilla oratoria]|uniref:organic cation transporter protein-like n=1 Tax=Oratosquilla oratoria TaxID=337810 RepID=UPI003F76FAFB
MGKIWQIKDKRIFTGNTMDEIECLLDGRIRQSLVPAVAASSSSKAARLVRGPTSPPFPRLLRQTSRKKMTATSRCNSMHEPADVENFEDVLSKIGFGKGQLPLYFAFCLSIFYTAPYLVSTTFQSAPADFACIAASRDVSKEILYLKDSPFYNGTDYSNNCYLSADLFPDLQVTQSPTTVDNSDNQDYSSTSTDSDVIVEESQISNAVGNKEIPCVDWEFDTSVFKSTFISEFNLVCGRQNLQPLFHVSYAVGFVAGDLFGGTLSDRFGRQKIYFMGVAFTILAAFLLVFIHNYYLDLLLRFVIGFGDIFFINSIMTHATENIPIKHRSLLVLSGFGSMVFFGEIGLCGSAYFTRDWRLMQLCIAAPSILFIPLFFVSSLFNIQNVFLSHDISQYYEAFGADNQGVGPRHHQTSARHCSYGISPENSIMLDK